MSADEHDDERAAIVAEAIGEHFPHATEEQLRRAVVPGSKPAERFRILDSTAIWAERPPMQFAIAGILPHGSLAMICATGSSLKTWAANDLMTSRASGGKWLGRFDCEKGSALFVDWESGEDELCRRLVRLSAEPVEGVFLLSMPDLFFNSRDFETVVTQWAKTYGLIALDSLAAGTVDLDENDARFAQGLRILKRVAAATGAVFVVLHHSRKGRPEGEGDDRDSPRGTSAIFAAVDVLLQLSRADEGTFTVRQTKARGGKSVDPFVLRVDDDGERTTVRATDAPNARPKTADAKYEDLCDQLVAAACKHPDSSQTALIGRVAGRNDTKRGAIEELVESGRLVNLGTEARPKFRVGKIAPQNAPGAQ